MSATTTAAAALPAASSFVEEPQPLTTQPARTAHANNTFCHQPSYHLPFQPLTTSPHSVSAFGELIMSRRELTSTTSQVSADSAKLTLLPAVSRNRGYILPYSSNHSHEQQYTDQSTSGALRLQSAYSTSITVTPTFHGSFDSRHPVTEEQWNTYSTQIPVKDGLTMFTPDMHEDTACSECFSETGQGSNRPSRTILSALLCLLLFIILAALTIAFPSTSLFNIQLDRLNKSPRDSSYNHVAMMKNSKSEPVAAYRIPQSKPHVSDSHSDEVIAASTTATIVSSAQRVSESTSMPDIPELKVKNHTPISSQDRNDGPPSIIYVSHRKWFSYSSIPSYQARIDRIHAHYTALSSTEPQFDEARERLQNQQEYYFRMFEVYQRKHCTGERAKLSSTAASIPSASIPPSSSTPLNPLFSDFSSFPSLCFGVWSSDPRQAEHVFIPHALSSLWIIENAAQAREVDQMLVELTSPIRIQVDTAGSNAVPLHRFPGLNKAKEEIQVPSPFVSQQGQSHLMVTGHWDLSSVLGAEHGKVFQAMDEPSSQAQTQAKVGVDKKMAPRSSEKLSKLLASPYEMLKECANFPFGPTTPSLPVNSSMNPSPLLRLDLLRPVCNKLRLYLFSNITIGTTERGWQMRIWGKFSSISNWLRERESQLNLEHDATRLLLQKEAPSNLSAGPTSSSNSSVDQSQAPPTDLPSNYYNPTSSAYQSTTLLPYVPHRSLMLLHSLYSIWQSEKPFIQANLMRAASNTSQSHSTNGVSPSDSISPPLFPHSSHRYYLFFLRCSIFAHRTQHNIRMALANVFATEARLNKPRESFIDAVVVGARGGVDLSHSSIEYDQLLLSSVFCLVPQGDTPSSRRLFDSILAGCIPVIASNNLALPFDNILRWDAFSVRIDMWKLKANDSSELVAIKTMPQTEIARLRRNCLRVRYHFDYTWSPERREAEWNQPHIRQMHGEVFGDEDSMAEHMKNVYKPPFSTLPLLAFYSSMELTFLDFQYAQKGHQGMLTSNATKHLLGKEMS